MPDFLALDWEHRQVCGLDAEVDKSGVRVRKTFALTWPEGKSPSDDAIVAGAWLQEQFRALGLTAKNVIVTVPREDTITRVLEVPDVPAAELPEVVKFQAAAKSARALDTQLLDFLPLPSRAVSGSREVLVATIAKEQVDMIRTVLSRAGCELSVVSLTATAMVELTARLETDSAASSPQAVELALLKHEQRVEIALLRQRGLLLTHSARLPDDATDAEHEQQAIVAEVNRTLVALRRQHPELIVSRAWLWGDAKEYRDLDHVIAKRFGCDVRIVDPLTIPSIEFDGARDAGSHVLFTGPAGLLLGQSERMAPSLDFLNPRRPIVPRDLRRIWWATGTAAAVLLFGGAFAIRASRLGALETDITKQQREIKELDDTLKRSQPSVKSADTIQRWIDQRVVWVERFNDLAQTMQGTRTHYLTNLTCQPGTAGMVAALRGTGFARDRDDVEQLNARLTRAEGVTVSAHEITRPGVDGDYPFRFDLDLSWKPVVAKAPVNTKSATAPVKDEKK